ncbi:YSC84-related protein [Shivajiella indica]|uniref:YSC84-related protein n=1 Tax=Shivajiella indica TaxID=872115 RepID=A0ABW5BD67_9BACT
MKKHVLLTILFTLTLTVLFAQKEEKTDKLIKDSNSSKNAFLKADPEMAGFFDRSAGYVIFPNVGKGGLGVGAASGNGILFEKGNAVGRAKMTQVTIGFQAGGQAYQEVIFFEDQRALERFKDNKFEFSAQVSAVAAASGASADAKYDDGVLVFTLPKKGLMYEASVGGQKFSYTSF